MSVRIQDRDNGLAAHKKRTAHNARVTVGIHESEGSEPKETLEARSQRKEQAKRFREAGREDTRLAKLMVKLASFKGTAKARAKLEARIARTSQYREFTASRAESFAADRSAAESRGTTLIEIAEAHEFGIGVPQRSFVAGAVDENEDQLQAKLVSSMKAAARPNATRTPEQTLERFGLYVVGVMQQRIADGIEPELAEATIKAKARLTGKAKDTPLILTGQLRSSIRSKLEITK